MPTSKGPDGRWRYRFTYQNERYSGSAPPTANTKRAADALEKQHVERLVARTFTGIMPTLREFAVQFLDYQRANKKRLTVNIQTGIVNNHLLPALGDRKLDEIGRRDIAQLGISWADVAAATRDLRLRVLHRMLSLAADWEIITSAPRIPSKKLVTEAPRFLTDAESAALIAAAAGKWRAMITVGLRTGLRIGELRGLRWGDITWLAGPRVHVQRTHPGGTHPPTTPKGGKSRVVPLTPDAIAALRTMLPAGGKPAPEAYVWPGETRDATPASSVCHDWIKKAVHAADLARPDEIAWHSLRHTFASQLAIRGRPLKVIQELLGHSSITQTEIYAHLMPGATHYAAVVALDTPYEPDDAISIAIDAPSEAPRQRAAKTLTARSESLTDTDT